MPGIEFGDEVIAVTVAKGGSLETSNIPAPFEPKLGSGSVVHDQIGVAAESVASSQRSENNHKDQSRAR